MVKKSKKLASVQPEFYQTDDANVRCTKLPEFLRAKKHLGAPFCVYVQDVTYVPEGTRVTVTAANGKNPNAEMKNNVAYMKNGVAEFEDMRFVGKSGRGSKFDVYIRFDVQPPKMVVYPNAIKVTVDGPRPPRHLKDKGLVKRINKSSHQKETTIITIDKKNEQWVKPIKKRYRELIIEEHDVGKLFADSLSISTSESCTAALPSTSSNVCPNHARSTKTPTTGSYYLTPPLTPTRPMPTDHNHRSVESIYGIQVTTMDTMHVKHNPTNNSINNVCVFNDANTVYKELINAYLLFYTDLYKIKITKHLANHLIDLVLSNLTSSGLLFESLNNNTNFMLNFNLFYNNLIENLKKSNCLKNNVLTPSS